MPSEAKTFNLWDTARADWLAENMPLISAVLSSGVGLIELSHQNYAVGVLGIVAAIISAIGVRATGEASKIRDQKLDQMFIWQSQDAAGEDYNL